MLQENIYEEPEQLIQNREMMIEEDIHTYTTQYYDLNYILLILCETVHCTPFSLSLSFAF